MKGQISSKTHEAQYTKIKKKKKVKKKGPD